MLTRFGDNAPEWGLNQESSGYVQDFSVKAVTEKGTLENEKGDTEVVIYYNKKWEGSITVVKKTGGALPTSFTATTTFANLSAYEGVGQVVIYESEKKPEQKGFTKYTYTFEAWATVDYTEVSNS